MERRIGEWQGESERLRPIIERIAAIEASSRMLSAMLPSHGYQGFRAAPPPSGWVQMGESWVLWWSGRQIAQVMPAKDRDVRVHLDARKMWQTKDERAAASPKASVTPNAGARPGSTRRCACARLRPGFGTPSRANRSNRCPAYRLPESSSNRSGVWPRPGCGIGANQGSAGTAPTAEGDQAPPEGHPQGVGEGRAAAATARLMAQG